MTGQLQYMDSYPTAKVFSCPRCMKLYNRKYNLQRHLRLECGVGPQFECPICHKKSKRKHNLMVHMRTHGENFELSI